MNDPLLSLKHVQRALTATLLLINCGPTPHPVESTECRAFRDLSFPARAERVRTSPVERQLDLYKCGMYIHPPADYAGEIAEGGEKSIPAVLERLKAEESETHKDDLIHVFEEMAKQGHLQGRRDIADQIRDVISVMKFDEIKMRAQKRLAIIESNL